MCGIAMTLNKWGICRGARSLIRPLNQSSLQTQVSENLQIVCSQAGTIENTYTTAITWGLECHSQGPTPSVTSVV